MVFQKFITVVKDLSKKDISNIKKIVASEENKAARIGKRILEMEIEEKKTIKRKEDANNAAVISEERTEGLLGTEARLNKQNKEQEDKLEGLIKEGEILEKENKKIEANNNQKISDAIDKIDKKAEKADRKAKSIIEKAKEEGGNILRGAQEQLDGINIAADISIDKKKAAERDTENATKRLKDINKEIEETKVYDKNKGIIKVEIEQLSQIKLERTNEIIELDKEKARGLVVKEQRDLEITEDRQKLEKQQTKMLGLLSRERRMNKIIPEINDVLTSMHKPII